MAYSPFVLGPLVRSLGAVLFVLYGLSVNYRPARKTGLPVIVLPFDCGHPLWLIVDTKVVQFVGRIPFCSGTFTRFNWRGWEIWDRYRAHQQLGDAIFFVTSGKNYLQLCDADAVLDIFQRRADFSRPVESTEILNIFGPDVGTSHHWISSGGLTEGEVYGNVFVFNFAGHDATANSLAIGICLLATEPDIQDWIAEEINVVLAGIELTESSYKATFPHLPRCLAVVFETVRLYTAVAIAKSTGSSPQPLKLDTNTVLIPQKTVIGPIYSALHTHPRYWGHDSLEFEPSRWIPPDRHIPRASDPHAASSHPKEHLKEPPNRNGPFVGWSGGARSCPGRKFAQVEFVGVLVGLFRDFKVKPVPLKGEDDEIARVRLLDQIRMDTGMRLVLQMLHPERAVLEWKRR